MSNLKNFNVESVVAEIEAQRDRALRDVQRAAEAGIEAARDVAEFDANAPTLPGLRESATIALVEPLSPYVRGAVRHVYLEMHTAGGSNRVDFQMFGSEPVLEDGKRYRAFLFVVPVKP